MCLRVVGLPVCLSVCLSAHVRLSVCQCGRLLLMNLTDTLPRFLPRAVLQLLLSCGAEHPPSFSLRWMLVLPGRLYSGQSAHGFWSYEPSPLMWTRHERLVCVARVARMPRAIQLLLQAVWEHTTCRAVFDLRARPPCSSSSETPTVNLATAQNQYGKQSPNMRSPNRVSNTKVEVVLGTTVPNWEYARQDVDQLSHASGHRAAWADQVWSFFL